VVVEHRVHPSLPLRSLLHQRVPTPHPGTQVEQVRRRDPRLREPTDQQQLPQVTGVRPIGLRALLFALQAAGLRRLRQMRLSTDPLELLDHKPPARRRLQRDLKTLTVEPGQERAHRTAVRRRDPRP
jgi:hypothetical protein